MTAIGTLGLGFSSSLVFVPFTLDAAGEFVLEAVPAWDPATAGTTLYAQAGVQNLSAPFWIDLSAPTSSKLRSPRLFLTESSFSLFGTVVTETLSAWNVTETNPLWSLSFQGAGFQSMSKIDLIHSEKHDLLIAYPRVQGAVGDISIIDAETGTIQGTLGGQDQGGPFESKDPDEFFSLGSGSLNRVALPSGVISASIVVPQFASMFTEVASVTGRRGYIANYTEVFPVDLDTNTIGAPIVSTTGSGFFAIMKSQGERVFLMQNVIGGQAKVHVIDTTTNLPVAGSPVSLIGSGTLGVINATRAESGPLVYGASADTGRFDQLEEGPLRVTNTSTQVSVLNRYIESNAQGDTWFVAGELGVRQIDIGTFSQTNPNWPLTTTPLSGGSVGVLKSDTFDGMFATSEHPGGILGIYVIPADPLSLPLLIATKPLNGEVTGVLSDSN